MSPPEILLEVVLLISSIIASVVIDKVHSNGHNKLKSAASREVALAQRRSEPVKRYGQNLSNGKRYPVLFIASHQRKIPCCNGASGIYRFIHTKRATARSPIAQSQLSFLGPHSKFEQSSRPGRMTIVAVCTTLAQRKPIVA